MPPAPGRHKLPHQHQGTAKPHGGWKDRKGTRQERGYGKDWQAIRQAVIARDLAMCQPCRRQGRVTAFDEVDHITPLSQGGENSAGNAECICRPCHKRKTSREAAQARRMAG
ncbi:HNH endonuclease [Gemmobacter denitrificans]|uniref:Putative HNH nuclease YajD n=1 Tax=Gemmobacter denitrificans TaxID=3123040 RepID=A0ABU8BQZ5_9RHOB